ncbi:MAG: hypothetical protein J6T53_00140 [Bacteroidales bacterium]|nr:hypothetical protein [Bacteroidales bacterium]
MRKKKVMVSLLLDKEVVDWLDGEAANDDTTLDEFVNNRLTCLKSVNSLDEKRLRQV